MNEIRQAARVATAAAAATKKDVLRNPKSRLAAIDVAVRAAGVVCLRPESMAAALALLVELLQLDFELNRAELMLVLAEQATTNGEQRDDYGTELRRSAAAKKDLCRAQKAAIERLKLPDSPANLAVALPTIESATQQAGSVAHALTVALHAAETVWQRVDAAERALGYLRGLAELEYRAVMTELRQLYLTRPKDPKTVTELAAELEFRQAQASAKRLKAAVDVLGAPRVLVGIIAGTACPVCGAEGESRPEACRDSGYVLVKTTQLGAVYQECSAWAASENREPRLIEPSAQKDAGAAQ